jgi:hypothetical protein
MSMLGRRKHSRYLLARPIDAIVRVRDEVLIELLDERELVVLGPEACRPDEQVSLEIPDRVHTRVHARVAESRPVVAEDGAIRHRMRLVVSPSAELATSSMEKNR